MDHRYMGSTFAKLCLPQPWRRLVANQSNGMKLKQMKCRRLCMLTSEKSTLKAEAVGYVRGYHLRRRLFEKRECGVSFNE